MVHVAWLLPDWNSLDSVRSTHAYLEAAALICFAALVFFDVLAHLADDGSVRAKQLTKIGLVCFALAIFAEILAYPYSRRNDTLSNQQAMDQQAKVADLNHSTQRLRTDAEIARTQAEGFKAQIADSDTRARAAEAQVAIAKAASDAAAAKAEEFRLDIAKANERAAEANRVTEQERLARLQLQDRIADRTITVEQQSAIKAQLSSITGVTVDALVWGDTAEVQNIAILVLDSIPRPGWTVHTGQAAGGGAAVTGILVGVKPGSDANIRRAADLLVSALQSAGLAASLWSFDELRLPGEMLNADITLGTSPMRLFIGSKPNR